jgi:hypothetical protein
VQVAHHGDALDDPLARELENETEHSVRGGVLRTHVENELLDLALFDLDRRQGVSGRVCERPPLDPAGGYVLTTFHDLLA